MFKFLINLAIVLMLAFLGYSYMNKDSIFSPIAKSNGGAQHSDSSKGAEVKIGNDFILTDQDGKTVDTKKLHGKYLLVTFGFASCKTTCPVTLGLISSVMEGLKKDANRVVPLFIDVDPKDTIDILKKHSENFDSSIRMLFGSKEKIKEVVDFYKVYVSEVDKKGQFNHSGYIYLMDKSGNYITHFSPSFSDSSKASSDVVNMIAEIKKHF